MSDPVNHPSHYAEHPSGVEVIEITRHLNFNLGNAVKYICRHQLKGNPKQDLEKAMWYISDEFDLIRIPLAEERHPRFPEQARVNLASYLSVERYLIAHDPPKATLCANTVDALQYLSVGSPWTAVPRLREAIDSLA